MTTRGEDGTIWEEVGISRRWGEISKQYVMSSEVPDEYRIRILYCRYEMDDAGWMSAIWDGTEL